MQLTLLKLNIHLPSILLEVLPYLLRDCFFTQHLPSGNRHPLTGYNSQVMRFVRTRTRGEPRRVIVRPRRARNRKPAVEGGYDVRDISLVSGSWARLGVGEVAGDGRVDRW